MCYGQIIRGSVMSEKKNRTSDMLQYIKPYMEECFQGACRIIQAEIEKNGLRIWDELKGIILEVLLLTDYAQRQGKKGNAEYLLFSFLGRSFIMDRLQRRIETFDNGFYAQTHVVHIPLCCLPSGAIHQYSVL